MAGRATDGKQRIALAAVAGAHGIKGEVRLKLFSDSAESLAHHPKLLVGGIARKLTACAPPAKARSRASKALPIAVPPKQLRGSLVEIERAALPPLAEGEYYHADLIGLPCFDGEGASLGTVVAVENFGAGDLLEIADWRRPPLADPVQARHRRTSRTAGSSSTPNSSPSAATAPRLARVVADRGRRDPAFAHRMADLVEADHHVARGINAPVRWSAGGHRRQCSRPRRAARRASPRAGYGCPTQAPDRRCQRCSGPRPCRRRCTCR